MLVAFIGCASALRQLCALEQRPSAARRFKPAAARHPLYRLRPPVFATRLPPSLPGQRGRPFRGKESPIPKGEHSRARAYRVQPPQPASCNLVAWPDERRSGHRPATNETCAMPRRTPAIGHAMTPTDLKALLAGGETSTVEFKRDDLANHELAKALVAFLNVSVRHTQPKWASSAADQWSPCTPNNADRRVEVGRFPSPLARRVVYVHNLACPAGGSDGNQRLQRIHRGADHATYR